MTAQAQDHSPEDALRALRGAHLFMGLSDTELQRIAEVAQEIVVPAGESLFEEGDAGDTFYVMARGVMEIVKAVPGGGEEKLAVRRAGDVFGEMAILNDAPRSATARALKDSELLTVLREDFETLVGGDGLSLRLMRALSTALRALDVRFVNLERTLLAGPVVARDDEAMLAAAKPRRTPTVKGFDIAAGSALEDIRSACTAWDTVHFSDGRTGLMVLTVQGHGPVASRQLAVARSLLNEFRRATDSVETLFARLNEGLCRSQVPVSDHFVAVGMLVPEEDSLVWSNAGGVQGTVIRRDGTLNDLPVHGPPLGMVEGFRHGTKAIPIGEGDLVAVLSSGSESHFRAMIDAISAQPNAPAESVVAHMYGALENVESEDPGDAAVLFVRKH